MKVPKLTTASLSLVLFLAGAAPPAALAMGCGQMDHGSSMGSGQMAGQGSMEPQTMGQAAPGQFLAPSAGATAPSAAGAALAGGNPNAPAPLTPADSGHTHQH